MPMAGWRIVWIGSLVLAGLCGFGYGWHQRLENPPFIITTKSKEPPEMKLLRRGRYEEAAKIILDSIKDQRKDYFRYYSVAAVYLSRAIKDHANREKWVTQAAFYVNKSVGVAPDDALNSMNAAFSMNRIGNVSSQSCRYYEQARQYAQDATSQLKGDSIFVGDEKMPTQPIRDDLEKFMGKLQGEIAAKCTNTP